MNMHVTAQPLPVAARPSCRVAELLVRARLPLDTEAALQRAIEEQLIKAKLTYAREVKVAGGRIDFLEGYAGPCGPHTECTGIEVKIKGGKRAIWRQCDAYCGDPRIARLIVVTAIALGLPPVMRGKPVTIIQLGRAWL
jgi:hypothetical protein